MFLDNARTVIPILHEVLPRHAIADKRIQGSQSHNKSEQSSSEMLAGNLDGGLANTTSGTNGGLFPTGW